MTLIGDQGGRLARDEVTGLGSAMAGGKGKLAKTARRAYDFYPTPADCTQALLIAESEALREHCFPFGDGEVWEPCGHGGAIARILAEFGFSTVATDIRPDPANRVSELDLLAAETWLAPAVVTNMPFALAAKMIAHLIRRLKVTYLACLLKSTFWSTSSENRGRVGLWRDHPPSRRWDMGWRPDFLEGQGPKGQGSTMLCTWFIWDSLAPPPPHPAMIPCGLLLRDGPVPFGRTGGLFHEEPSSC